MKLDKFKKIVSESEELLNLLKNNNLQYLFILQSDDSDYNQIGTAMLNIRNPYSLELAINGIMDKADSDDCPPSYKVLSAVLANSVLQYLNKSNSISTYKKYDQFKLGNLDGLTDDEINKFIDMANSESSNDKFYKEILTLIDSLFISIDSEIPSDSNLSYHLYFDFKELVYKVISNNFKYTLEELKSISYNILTEIYGKREVIINVSELMSVKLYESYDKIKSISKRYDIKKIR